MPIVSLQTKSFKASAATFLSDIPDVSCSEPHKLSKDLDKGSFSPKETLTVTRRLVLGRRVLLERQSRLDQGHCGR